MWRYDGYATCAWCGEAEAAPLDPRFDATRCAALGASLRDSPADFFEGFGTNLANEMRAHTPQAAGSAAQLVMQVLVATLAVFIVIDTPRGGSDGKLWGAED